MPDANEVPWSLPLSELGKWLEELRERRDLTQGDVVQRLRDCGVRTDVSALSRIESGKRRFVPRELVEALLTRYDAEPDTRQTILSRRSSRETSAWSRHHSSRLRCSRMVVPTSTGTCDRSSPRPASPAA